MINLSHFRYASIRAGFGSAGASAAATASSNTDKIKSLLATSVSGASSSSPFESASQNQISGASTLAANAAIARVKADAAAKSKEITNKIDSAQSALNDAKKTSDGSMIVGYTVVQKYVSWVYSPPNTTTDTTA